MAPRANGNGYLKLSLVSYTVALFPATTTRERVRFNVINRETGNRVRYHVVDADTGEEVPQEARIKGQGRWRQLRPAGGEGARRRRRDVRWVKPKTVIEAHFRG